MANHDFNVADEPFEQNALLLAVWAEREAAMKEGRKVARTINPAVEEAPLQSSLELSPGLDPAEQAAIRETLARRAGDSL